MRRSATPRPVCRPGKTGPKSAAACACPPGPVARSPPRSRPRSRPAKWLLTSRASASVRRSEITRTARAARKSLAFARSEKTACGPLGKTCPLESVSARLHVTFHDVRICCARIFRASISSPKNFSRRPMWPLRHKPEKIRILGFRTERVRAMRRRLQIDLSHVSC